ncbi:MAG: hypothetical protein K2X08_05865 [Chlamydiales bacterium]|nr:hypothetical protein [Chlamydiales bacterium]
MSSITREMTTTTTQTDFGYLSEVRFKPDNFVTESFLSRAKMNLQDKGDVFYIQYLHDAETLDPKYLELVDKISQLFLHIYFPQEDSLKKIHNPCFRFGGCWNVSELIANYAQKTFPELQIQLLANQRMSSNFIEASIEAEKDPIKKKYLHFTHGTFHVLGHGSNNGLNFAFDSLGIDFLNSVYFYSEEKAKSDRAKPLAQVFIADNNKKLQDILNHRYVSQENWVLFSTTGNPYSAKNLLIDQENSHT